MDTLQELSIYKMNQNGLSYLVAKLWNHQVVIQSFLIGPWSLLHYLHIRISILPNVRGESKRTSLLSRKVVKPPGSNPTFSVGPFLISSSLLFSKQLTDLMKTYWRWDSNRRSLVFQATADQPLQIIWPRKDPENDFWQLPNKNKPSFLLVFFWLLWQELRFMAAVAVVPGHWETGKGKGSCYIEIFLKIYLGVLFVRFMIGLQIQTKFQRNLWVRMMA